MLRTRAFRRHQRQRAIARKKNVIKNIWQINVSEYTKDDGRLSKKHLNCACPMCKSPRYSRKGNDDVCSGW